MIMEYSEKRINGKLISNIILSWCICKSDEKKIFFDRLYFSNGRAYFYTDVISKVFKPYKNTKGYWKNGNSILYEITFDEKGININLLTSCILVKDRISYDSFLNSNGVMGEYENISTIKSWNILPANPKLESIAPALDLFFSNVLLDYEQEIKKWIANHDYSIFEDKFYIEGAQKQILANKFERNSAARKKCIEIHGAYCHICGFNFGETYGKDFAEKIEVHHIVPLNEIREDYKVNPEKDLIPVCSNCHMILHSKKEGVYTPDEVKQMLKK